MGYSKPAYKRKRFLGATLRPRAHDSIKLLCNQLEKHHIKPNKSRALEYALEYSRLASAQSIDVVSQVINAGGAI